MAYRRNMLSVLWPVIFIATASGVARLPGCSLGERRAPTGPPNSEPRGGLSSEVSKMQAYEIAPEIRMTRDMDLIRTLLLWIEAQPQLDGTRWLAPDKPEDVGVSDHSIEEVQYHLNLLIEAGFVEGKSFDAAGTVVFSRLTWKGHEFLENI